MKHKHSHKPLSPHHCNHPSAATTTMFYCPSATSDLNRDGDKHLADVVTKEVMFQKPLTPSDVGKLNRLVIPKQYAEKYFPPTGVSSTGEKGLLLSFEDDEVAGKCWRFRYSYWNSSQSYVLTKGWSRFIKEKQLHAGDLVLFARGGGSLFIGLQRHYNPKYQVVGESQPAGYSVNAGENAQNHVHGGRSKILRLFGVDMECQPDEFEFIAAAQGCSSTSSYDQDLSHPTSYMATNFSGDDTQD